jgi:hypothetical protein
MALFRNHSWNYDDKLLASEMSKSIHYHLCSKQIVTHSVGEKKYTLYFLRAGDVFYFSLDGFEDLFGIKARLEEQEAVLVEGYISNMNDVTLYCPTDKLQTIKFVVGPSLSG